MARGMSLYRAAYTRYSVEFCGANGSAEKYMFMALLLMTLPNRPMNRMASCKISTQEVCDFSEYQSMNSWTRVG